MNEDPNRLSNHGGEDDVMDRDDDVKHRERRDRMEALDRVIYCAIAKSEAPALPDDADSAAALTEADRAALEALGTPEELARRVYARAQRNVPPRSEAPVTTYADNQLARETIPNGPHEAAAPDPKFEELLSRHRACHQVECFEWKCEFVKKEQEIGQGGQGVVYRIQCTDEFVGNRALKILSPEPYCDAQSYRQDMQRMRDVAALVHQIYHDNLIYVERFEPHYGIYLMFMRLIDGFDLQRLLDPKRIDSLQRAVDERRWREELNQVVFASPRGDGQWGLAPGVAVSIVQKCLRGLSALHDKGIVHCDIKPSNIMLDCHGSIRLIDIGSAFQLDSPPQRLAWTPRYAPPEVLENDEWTKQGDLASLGYVLIELLSGQLDLMEPLASSNSVHTLDKETRFKLAESKRQLPGRLEQLIPAKAGESRRLKKLCKKLIAPDPAKRFASAEEAFDWTVEFLADLVGAQLSMPWVKVIKHLVTDAKKAMGSADDHG